MQTCICSGTLCSLQPGYTTPSYSVWEGQFSSDAQPNRAAGQDDEQIVNVVFYEKSLAQNVKYLN